jgi:WD40 repeat protein
MTACRSIVLFMAVRALCTPNALRSTPGGHEPATVLNAEHLEVAHLWPQFLPDGRHFLFLADAAVNVDHAIKVGELDRTESRVVIKPVGSGAIFAPAGYLLYTRDEKLVARPFDVARVESAGDEFPVLEEGAVRVQLEDDHYNPVALSLNNVLVYRQAPSPFSELVWRDRSGARVGTLGAPAKYEDPVMSADGTRVAVGRPDRQGHNWDIWIMDVAKGSSQRLTTSPAPDSVPVWSPDGTEMIFRSFRENHDEIYRTSAINATMESQITLPGLDRNATDWSPDAHTLIVNALKSVKGDYDIWAIRLSDFHATALVQTPQNDTGGSVSPDGRWIAYVSDDSGTPEVFVQRFPDATDRQQISSQGGTEPIWRGDGGELFYLSADGHLMAVDIHQSANLLGEGESTPLFEARPTRGRYEALSAFNQRSYAVTPDGERFLFNIPLEERAALPVMVVLNWSANQLVPPRAEPAKPSAIKTNSRTNLRAIRP